MLLSLFTACAVNDKQPDNTDKTSTTTETAATDGEILKFALVGPLTGAGAQYGLAYQMACEYLVEKTNANGGINGAMVELEVYDDKQDPTETLNIANLLVEDKDLLGVVGSRAHFRAVLPARQPCALRGAYPRARTGAGDHPSLLRRAREALRLGPGAGNGKTQLRRKIRRSGAAAGGRSDARGSVRRALSRNLIERRDAPHPRRARDHARQGRDSEGLLHKKSITALPKGGIDRGTERAKHLLPLRARAAVCRIGGCTGRREPQHQHDYQG